MVPWVDFHIVDSIFRVLEGWELGNSGLYKKYQSYKEIIKISKFSFGPRSPKNRCLRFFQIFYGKAWGFTDKRPLRYGRFFKLSNALMGKSLTPTLPKEKDASTPSVACLAVF